jgi:hypothetical protein
MIPKPIPLHSLYDLPPLTWAEVKYGWSRQLLGWRTVTDIAASKVEEGSGGALAVDLAAVGNDDDWKIDGLVQRLSENETEPVDEIEETWLFIALKWLYENKADFKNPLREVEELYAEFDYPSVISQLVGFLPPANGYRPELRTSEENEKLLYDLWAAYLKSTARHLLTRVV